MSKELYFIALLPTKEIQEEVTRFKAYAAEHFNSSHALKSPPHLTLFPPFRWESGREDELRASLRSFSREEASIYVGLNGFDEFPPRVIFVKVEESDDLRQMQAKLEEYLHTRFGLENDSPHDFHPHMTVAFKDLKPSTFREAQTYFAQLEYVRMFRTEALSLLKHQQGKWIVIEDFSLSP